MSIPYAAEQNEPLLKQKKNNVLDYKDTRQHVTQLNINKYELL